ncbi:MAG TPA: alpha/beta hydrolase [Gemmatimonadales bacterium]|nr:alpha/beta hydrolase [Gemmatimonadales bacterium]
MRRGVAVAAAAGALMLAAGSVWWEQGAPERRFVVARVSVATDSSPTPTYRLDKVTIAATDGAVMTCALRRPARPAAPHSCIGAVLSGGIETGRRAALLVAPSFDGLVLSCDYPWRDPTRLSKLRFLLTLPAVRREVLATPAALQAAANYLLSRAEVDPTRLAAVGASLGVPAVSAWAARDPRVAAVALVMGGADLEAILEANLGGQVRWRALRWPVAAVLARLLRPLEPGRTVGRVAPRPLLIIGAAGDERIPRRSTELLFTAAGGPKDLLWVGGRHMLPRDTVLLRSITDSTLAWVRRHLPSQR